MAAKPKLLYVVTEDWYFVSHRLQLARAAASAGYDVGVAVRVKADAGPIEAAGLTLFPLRHLRRSSINPLNEAAAISELTALYRSWRPTLVHHVAAKPVIYGGIAARLAGVPAVVSALAGLGFVYASTDRRARLLRPLMRAAFRVALRQRRGRLILQNRDDELAVRTDKLVDATQIRIVGGSGVDVSRFTPPAVEPPPPMTVMLASRMLWDKGIREFVEAAKALRADKSDARFVLVGESDTENPSAIPRQVLEGWKHDGCVEWWGHRNDMPPVLHQAHILCLPSFYGEGLPKILLEAAACGRPMIASDAPGCREIVQHGKTGLLVRMRDAESLTCAIKTLIADSALRDRLARAARELVASRFTTEHVNEATLAVYAELLDDGRRGRAVLSIAPAS